MFCYRKRCPSFAVAIAQHVDTGSVLMQGIANRDALSYTISSKKATFYIYLLNYSDGHSCHTGSERCHYISGFGSLHSSQWLILIFVFEQAKEIKLAMTTLQSLEATIVQRKAESSTAKPSGTRRYLWMRYLGNGHVLYHAMVLYSMRRDYGRGLDSDFPLIFSGSGIEEKRSGRTARKLK
ncbi:hypothetical protein DCAR_0626459 [Daucus carota subsp. sativus]|uniref:Uncharacterized protein n=1 Tax=Daucus carota subsp. sativus TaxID=79200 RepID=A0AAF0XFW3_DAUCS|nr:hypothetical protein DCAR_0626459 [Daucus carota subsp. sativus]